MIAYELLGAVGFLNDPLYGSITAGVLILLGVLCFTKVEQPLIGLVLLAGAAYLGYNIFTAVGN